jgi:hypothetical protein
MDAGADTGATHDEGYANHGVVVGEMLEDQSVIAEHVAVV